MIIRIVEGHEPGYLLLGSNDKRFTKVWGQLVRVPNNLVYQNFAEITAWANNELGEEVLFEVD